MKKNRRSGPSAALPEAQNGVSHSIASGALHMDHSCGFFWRLPMQIRRSYSVALGDMLLGRFCFFLGEDGPQI